LNKFTRQLLWIECQGDDSGCYPIGVTRKKAAVLTLSGKWPQAGDILLRNLAKTEESGLSAEISQSHIDLGALQLKQGDFKGALGHCRMAVDLAEELSDPVLNSAALNNLGTVYFNMGEYQQAEECYQQRQLLAKQLGDRQAYGESLNNLGTLYNDRGQYQKAMECFREKLDIARKLGDRQGEGLAWGNIAMVQYYTGNLKEVEENLLRQMTLAQSIGDIQMVSLAAGNLGILYMDMGDYEKSLDFSIKKLNICRTLGDKSGINSADSNIGLIYYYRGEYKRALEYLAREIEACREMGDKLGVALAAFTVGNINKECGDYVRAAELYAESLATVESIGMKYYSCDILINQAELAEITGHLEEAARLSEKALEHAKEVNRADITFQAEVFRAKQTARLNPELARDKLFSLLLDAGSDQEKAQVKFELYWITHDEPYRDQALILYKELYQRTPKALYQMQIKKLTENKRGP